MYVAATQYMLGVRASWDGLVIDPCLPEEMLPARVTRVFRGCRYEIEITRNERAFIPHEDGRETYSITI